MANASRIHYNDVNPFVNYLPGKATHIRVYKEDYGDEFPWCVDAVDDVGNYSEAINRYATHAEAMKHGPTELLGDLPPDTFGPNKIGA